MSESTAEPHASTESPDAPSDLDTPAQGTGAEAEGNDESTDPPSDGPLVETTPSRRLERLEAEGDAAADFLEELLDIVDLDGDIDLDVEGDRATVSVVGGDLLQLVGEQGKVLDALQELTRLAVLQETGERSRLMLDIAGHRAQRRSELEKQANEAAETVRTSGEALRLSAMNPFERKVVHDAIAAAGLRSESEGEEPQRRVVVLPGADVVA